MPENKIPELSNLKSLGPKSQIMLAKAGITTLIQLQEVGAVAAYVKVRQSGQVASLNLLWALESALTGIPWQQVARQHRSSLLLAVDTYIQLHKQD